MPSLSTVSSWYKYSQIEYFTPFMKLWLAFNSWYKQFYPTLSTDRAIVDTIKTNSLLKDNFSRLIDTQSDEGKELREASAILVNEIRIQGFASDLENKVNFNQSDLNPNFISSQGRSRTNWLNANTGNYILLNETTVVISDKSVLFQEVFEVLYQIRCSLIHGDFEIEDRRSNRLVKSGYIILNSTFGPIVQNTL